MNETIFHRKLSVMANENVLTVLKTAQAQEGLQCEQLHQLFDQLNVSMVRPLTSLLLYFMHTQ